MNDTLEPSPRPPTLGRVPSAHGERALRARFSEWLLRREALARARSFPDLAEPERALLAQAREAARAGAFLADVVHVHVTVAAADETRALTPEAAAKAALDVYGESAFWALRALVRAERGGAADGPHASLTPAEARDESDGALTTADELTRAFAEAPAERLLEVAGSREALDAARAALQPRSFERARALAHTERQVALGHAQRFVDALLRTLDARNALVPHLLMQRYARLLGLLVALVLAVFAVRYGALELSRALRTDLAPGASWRVSTTAPPFAASGSGFPRPEGGPNIFFKTQIEDSPWIEFDLGAPRALRGVSIDNRLDCCQDYATPLLVELSDDGKAWREVARRESRFYYWTEWFPESRARYLRLRVDRRTALHLGPVAIY